MSETESSLSRFTANAAGVQSHEVGLKGKAAGKREQVQSHGVRLKRKGKPAHTRCESSNKFDFRSFTRNFHFSLFRFLHWGKEISLQALDCCCSIRTAQ